MEKLKPMSIVINKKDGKKFEVPEDGLYPAVLADIVDLGEVETQWGKKHRIRFIYILEATDKGGRQFRVFHQLNASLHEKSTMYKVVRRLLGKDPGKSIDLDVLLGKQCQLDVQQSESEGSVYANVISVLANQKGQNVTIPADFVREVNKNKEPAKTVAPAAAKRSDSTGVSVTPQTETVNL
jgi:hypothetical protein